MREVYKVVILLDLDLVSSLEGDINTFSAKVKCLRRTVLNVLTVFSIQHTDLLNESTDPQFRWGCKFYCSSQKKKITQKFQFSDFNLEVLKNFEIELEQQCRIRREEWLAQKAVKHMVEVRGDDNDHQDRHETPGNCHSQTIASSLKDILCDYSWNELVVDSPSRGSALNQGTSRRRNNQSLNHEFPTKQEQDESTKNFVVIISSVPKSPQSWDTFLGGNLEEEFNVNDFLRAILPLSIRHQFHNVAGINLLWLDLTLNESHNVSNQSSLIDYPKLVDGALKTVGGGLIPLNSSLEFLLSQNERWPSCSGCPKFSFPKVMECSSPFSSAMSGLLTHKANTVDRQTNSPFRSKLHIDGIDSRMLYELELMTLFGSNRSIRFNPKWDKQENIASNRSEVMWFPKNLHTIGTISIHDIQSQLIARPFLFVCNGTNEFEKNAVSSFHHLLTELVNQQQALLLSCDHVCQGILFPANSRAKVAMLYILTDVETVSTFTSMMGHKIASPSAEINTFIQNLLNDWNSTVTSPFENEVKNIVNVSIEEASSSPSVMSKWIANNKSNLSETSVEDKQRLSNQDNLDEKLKQAYQNEGNSVIEQIDQPRKRRQSERLKAGANTMTDMSQKSVLQNEAIKKYLSEEDLVTELRVVYDLTITDCEFVKRAKEMVTSVVNYCKENTRNECPMALTEKVICQHFLASPRTISNKYTQSYSAAEKIARVNDHFMQAVLRLELLSVLPLALTVDINEITDHIRIVSFLSSIEEATKFIKSVVVENYYTKLKEEVSRLCQDLNQPISTVSEPESSDSDFPSSPNRLELSSLGDIPEPSSVDSTCDYKIPNKRKKLARNPSFTSKLAPQVFVPAENLKTLKASGINKESHTSRTKTRGRKPSSKQPTTPQGRRVLKTKKAAETPISKQVDNSVLRRQSLRRKSNDNVMNEDCLIINETPDKNCTETPNKNDWTSSHLVRRSPRMHVCSIERDVAICSTTADASNSCTNSTNKELVTDSSKGNAETISIPKQSCKGMVTRKSNSRLSTPERRSSVRRHLNLGGFPSPNVKSTKKNDDQDVELTRRNLRSDLKHNLAASANQLKSSTSSSKIDSRRSEKLSKRLNFSSRSKAESEGHRYGSKSSTKDVIPSTPTRNGVESPETLLEDLCLMYDSLSNGLDGSLSRSSSPRIPLLFDESADVGGCHFNNLTDKNKTKRRASGSNGLQSTSDVQQQAMVLDVSQMKSNSSDYKFVRRTRRSSKLVLSEGDIPNPWNFTCSSFNCKEITAVRRNITESRSESFEDNTTKGVSRGDRSRKRRLTDEADIQKKSAKIKRSSLCDSVAQASVDLLKLKSTKNIPNLPPKLKRTDLNSKAKAALSSNLVNESDGGNKIKAVEYQEGFAKAESLSKLKLSKGKKDKLEVKAMKVVSKRSGRIHDNANSSCVDSDRTKSRHDVNQKNKLRKNKQVLDKAEVKKSTVKSPFSTSNLKTLRVHINTLRKRKSSSDRKLISPLNDQDIQVKHEVRMTRNSKKWQSILKKQSTTFSKVDLSFSDDSSDCDKSSTLDTRDYLRDCNSPELFQNSDSITNKPKDDSLAPQRFTRLTSKEIGLTLDAFTEISTIPSKVPMKAVDKLTKRYGTLPSELKTLSTVDEDSDSDGEKSLKKKDGKSSKETVDSKKRSKQQKLNRCKSAALVKNSLVLLRQLRSSAAHKRRETVS